MINIIPRVKFMEETGGLFECGGVCVKGEYDARIMRALSKLPQDASGADVEISLAGDAGEGYELWISPRAIRIAAQGPAGAFYAVQTLRQIFTHDKIPCLHIEDEPDFPYRGFYHDITRGKVAKLETLKWLVEEMAYYKLNSLQLYVEHTFEFEECRELVEKTGCITAAEIRELDEFCKDHFVEFIPSLSSFGHMFEILDMDKHRHLRVLKDYKRDNNFWRDRMRHHTIDPREEESIGLIKSLIDQYSAAYTSEYFNICCDETFDLKTCDSESRLYIEFVKKIISHVTGKGKRVMMWADILLEHPETITMLPDGICYLNWNYLPDAKEDGVIEFKKLGKPQILCPGTWSWSRLCERFDWEEQNISRMAEYGKRNGAVGILNTNWGDRGNPCSLELAMYGMVLGAEKSWSADTPVDDVFHAAASHLLYGEEIGVAALHCLSDIHTRVDWNEFGEAYFAYRYGGEKKEIISIEDIAKLRAECRELFRKLSARPWGNDEYRQEMLIAVEGLCVMAELNAKIMGHDIIRVTDTKEWLAKFREKWLAKNKPSELCKIEEMFMYIEENRVHESGDGQIQMLYFDRLDGSGLFDAVCEALEMADIEFVPPISARTSSTQAELSDASGGGVENYCASLADRPILAAVEGETLVGFMAFAFDYTCDNIQHSTLPNIYVSTAVVPPPFRGRGLMRGLYAELCRRFPDRSIFTRTWHTNAAHIRVLDKLGFSEIARIENHRGGGIDTVYFAKCTEQSHDHP